MTLDSGHLEMLRREDPDSLPPDPVEVPDTLANTLTIALVAIPAAAGIIVAVVAPPSGFGWTTPAAVWAAFLLVVLVKIRHSVHWSLQLHLCGLRWCAYQYRGALIGAPCELPELALQMDQHYPSTAAPLRELWRFINVKEVGEPQEEDTALKLRRLAGQVVPTLHRVRMLERLDSSCDTCRWRRLLDRALWWLPLPN
jgi:hypothetical protein